jgi:hypothetical protein
MSTGGGGGGGGASAGGDDRNHSMSIHSIHNLIHGFMYNLDTGNDAGFAALFTQDAVLEV